MDCCHISHVRSVCPGRQTYSIICMGEVKILMSGGSVLFEDPLTTPFSGYLGTAINWFFKRGGVVLSATGCLVYIRAIGETGWFLRFM